ncbi:uncharacterized protein A4U43_C09F8820 [Asparagus officinalis]|uniref:Uncharacterized protein n=1 Tax=Asparagus officinalis TaxID=4686 RepID=A0A5P1E6S8_ASPOF|nr:uncharacterized protein A4U43_C09F8820 [Asparagus officinalis]
MSLVSPFVYVVEHWFQFMPKAKLHVLRSLAMRNGYSRVLRKLSLSADVHISFVQFRVACRRECKETKGERSIGAAKPKPSEAEISVSRLDIRVGLIKKVQKHPDADIRGILEELKDQYDDPWDIVKKDEHPARVRLRGSGVTQATLQNKDKKVADLCDHVLESVVQSIS